jgi:hypothetical protein
MLLPRPARIVRRHVTPLRAVRATHSYEVDESFHPHMDDMTMGLARQQPTVPATRPASIGESRRAKAYGLTSSGQGAFEGEEHDEDEGGREERRAPATVVGTKRTGLVILPELLTNAIQQEINGQQLAHVPTQSGSNADVQVRTLRRSAATFSN